MDYNEKNYFNDLLSEEGFLLSPALFSLKDSNSSNTAFILLSLSGFLLSVIRLSLLPRTSFFIRYTIQVKTTSKIITVHINNVINILFRTNSFFNCNVMQLLEMINNHLYFNFNIYK